MPSESSEEWVDVRMMSVVIWQVKCHGRDLRMSLGEAERGNLLQLELGVVKELWV